jgi:hypothetical protein
MQETLSGLAVPHLYSNIPPRLMPMNAGFFENPYFPVRKAYQASHSVTALLDIPSSSISSSIGNSVDDLGLGSTEMCAM